MLPDLMFTLIHKFLLFDWDYVHDTNEYND